MSQSSSGAIAGVLYAEDFDEPLLEQQAAALEPEPVVIVPSFTLEELRSAAEAAREEGRRAERQVLMGSLEARRLALLTTLADELRASREQAARVAEDAVEQLAATVLAAVATALPGLCAHHGAAEIGLLLRRILPPLRQAAGLQIRLHPSARAAVAPVVAELLDDAAVPVSWTESDALAPGDVVVRWTNGDAQRDTASLCEQIRSALLELFPTQAAPPTASPMIGLGTETDHVE